jgi:hypothetical protein
MLPEGFQNAFAQDAALEVKSILLATQRPINGQCIQEKAPLPQELHRLLARRQIDPQKSLSPQKAFLEFAFELGDCLQTDSEIGKPDWKKRLGDAFRIRSIRSPND